MAFVINRRLISNYQEYLRQHFYLGCSDLKSCYDRIVQSSARLALQRLGIPLPEIFSILDTIQHMIHMVSMSYREYNIPY